MMFYWLKQQTGLRCDGRGGFLAISFLTLVLLHMSFKWQIGELIHQNIEPSHLKEGWMLSLILCLKLTLQSAILMSDFLTKGF